WVIYNGANDASRVPAEWHGWLHHSYDALPESHLPPPKTWAADYTPNPTGTPAAYLPQGALARGGRRARATGDYEAWTPDACDRPALSARWGCWPPARAKRRRPSPKPPKS